ncbi:MAG TPA: endonuclease/exonuclease/phosphatase family protein [Candidatus Polarisedimenticolaceae bacterium]|nr:endonuclease/exonuclease/phosphatase family protein [Candidatus Polarisedimenticolaceae bacterium]
MTISVLQWNIWYKEDIRNIAGFIKSQNADIVCLQELTVNHPEQTIKDAPAYIAQQLGYEYHYKELPIVSLEGESIMLANGIFSRFPITKKRFAWINRPKNNGGSGNEYRVYIEASLDVGGKNLHVGTTHMSYTERFESTPRKREETDCLVGELSKHDTSFIFTGDLNAAPSSYTIDEVQHLLQNAGPDVNQKTWTTKPFSYGEFKETELNWRLDYVFATRDIKVLSSEILQPEYSDHLPILTKFSFS